MTCDLFCVTAFQQQKPLKATLIKSLNAKQKYHTVGSIPKSNIKMVERGKIDTTNT